MRSCSGRRRRVTRSPTCALRSGMRSGSRSRATRWRRSSPAAAARRSWSSLPPCRSPVPSTTHAQAALAAASAELERAGVPMERQTLLVATGLTRRPNQRELEGLGIVSPGFARRFHGKVVIHDAEDPELVDLEIAGNVPIRANRALLDTDLVLTVSAAETVLHGGPVSLLGAAGPEALRAAGAYSLLETGASQGWRLGVQLERRLSDRLPVIGASLVLNQPRLTGPARGYPYDPEAIERISRSPVRRGFAPPPRLRARPRAEVDPRRGQRRRGLRRPSVGGARGGAPSCGRGALGDARRPARRDRDRDPAHDAAPPARAPEPAARRLPRPRDRVTAVARLVPDRRGRHGDPAAPIPPSLLAPDPAAVPGDLPGGALRERRG